MTSAHVVGRPKTPPVQAEREALVRVAELASSVMVTLRRPGRGEYKSKRLLGQWLGDDEVSYTAKDLGPALGLLEATKRIMRAPHLSPNSPRPGQLARGAELYVNAELSDKVPTPNRTRCPICRFCRRRQPRAVFRQPLVRRR